MEQIVNCSFCGVVRTTQTPLIAGSEGHICEACVQLAYQVVVSWGRKRSLSTMKDPQLIPSEITNRLDQHIVGQDLAKQTLAVAVYNHYTRLKHESSGRGIACSQDDVELAKSNVLLLGPSGTGKTLLASTLADIVGVPFAVADATTLTQAGYVGEDVENILVRLLDVAEGDVGRAEWGIVYIDEVDKLARSPEASITVRDVSGEGVQQALLKLIEGTHVKLPKKSRKREGGEDVIIDTTNILFIGGGAFADLDKLVAKRLAPARNGIGFNALVATEEQDGMTGEQLIANVHPEDLRLYGLIPEFIGRFPVLAPLNPLDEEAMVSILTEPKNALVRQYKRLFSYEGVELDFKQDALLTIASIALEQGTGARGLRAVMENILRPYMYDIPSNKNISHCIVDTDCCKEFIVEILECDEAAGETSCTASI